MRPPGKKRLVSSAATAAPQTGTLTTKSQSYSLLLHMLERALLYRPLPRRRPHLCAAGSNYVCRRQVSLTHTKCVTL
jgi:hypothetical protein